MYSLYRWRWNPHSAPRNLYAPTEPVRAKTNTNLKPVATPQDTRQGVGQWALHGLSVVILALAISSLAKGAYIHAKANLAQWLIANAWQQSLELQAQQANQQAKTIKPWPWADTWPVARLQYAKGNQDLYILAGAQGNTLAFGPGHQFGSARPGEIGVSIVGGHRDTHFAFLKHLKPGDELKVTGADGQLGVYTVTTTHIADSLTEPLLAMPYASQMLLVTCYPFDAVAGGSLRYVVTTELQTNVEMSRINNTTEVFL